MRLPCELLAFPDPRVAQRDGLSRELAASPDFDTWSSHWLAATLAEVVLISLPVLMLKNSIR
jgi:hypothetical protein